MINVVAIYSSEDKGVIIRLLPYLKSSNEDNKVSVWYDCSINSLEQWKLQSGSRLNQVDLVLLLVSDVFMHSEFIQDIAFKNVIDSYKEDKSTVIPILINNCPWDIDFNSDDYDFNLSELQVLPEGKKPIKDWDSPDAAYRNIEEQIKKVITSLIDEPEPEESNTEEQVSSVHVEDQVALDFDKEAEAKKRVEEKARIKEAEETRKKAEETKLKEAAEAKKRRIEDAALKRKNEEELRIKEETEIQRNVEKEKLKTEVEAKRRLEEENSVKDQEDQHQHFTPTNEIDSETQAEENTSVKRRALIGLLLAGITIVGIWMFSEFTSSTEKESLSEPEAEVSKIIDSDPQEKTKIDPPIKVASFTKLNVGDIYDGGIVFAIDAASKEGVIAHLEDYGPMSWEMAMKIHEQLGEGWRVPTFEELKTMYQTIGNGATNSGEFTKELYWSATDYDEYQARLVKFSDGNASYHYNKMAEHRKFKVRAVRNFNQ